MLEQVRSHTPHHAQRTASRRTPAHESLDEAHATVWGAVRDLFPAHAMVDQTDYGCLLVSWSLYARRGGKQYAAPVIMRIGQGLLLALWTCDDDSRREIAALVAADVAEALQSYDPYARVARCGVILLGE